MNKSDIVSHVANRVSLSRAEARAENADRSATKARREQHFRVRSRLSISGGSVCANGFLVGVCIEGSCNGNQTT